MNATELKEEFGHLDNNLFGMARAGEFESDHRILFAGCYWGGGNLGWFIRNNYIIDGIGPHTDWIDNLKSKYPALADRFQAAALESIPHEANTFDHVLCLYTLHYAQSIDHVHAMFSDMVRVLKPGGQLFIRMDSLNSEYLFTDYTELENGLYKVPHGDNRVLLTRAMIDHWTATHDLKKVQHQETMDIGYRTGRVTLTLKKL